MMHRFFCIEAHMTNIDHLSSLFFRLSTVIIVFRSINQANIITLGGAFIAQRFGSELLTLGKFCMK
jgi:hypothetical protein